jgi:predicted transcriptional regulator
MAKKKIPLEMGKRERQIVETVIKLGEASVAEVQENLADPPSYSAVRAMLGFLVDKKWLICRLTGFLRSKPFGRRASTDDGHD